MLFSWPTWQSVRHTAGRTSAWFVELDRRPSDAGSLASRCSPTLKEADCHVSFSHEERRLASSQ